jgi:hypothetical protein
MVGGFSAQRTADCRSGQLDRKGNLYISVKNSKSQITNNKQITITKIQNSKPVWVIEYWNLVFHWDLVLGI